jgi:hypothetical protein
MAEGLLIYDGTTYGLSADVVKGLLERGIIVADPSSGAAYELSLEHEIEEVEPFATVLERRDAPQSPRLGRLRVRGFSLFGGVEQMGFPPDHEPFSTRRGRAPRPLIRPSVAQV